MAANFAVLANIPSRFPSEAYHDAEEVNPADTM